jgi:hypothetical protein
MADGAVGPPERPRLYLGRVVALSFLAFAVAVWLIIGPGLLEVAGVLLVVSAVATGTYVVVRANAILWPEAPRSVIVVAILVAIAMAVAGSVYLLIQLD